MPNNDETRNDPETDIIKQNADALFEFTLRNILAKGERHDNKKGEAKISDEFIQSFIKDVKKGFDDSVRFATADINEAVYLPKLKDQSKAYQTGKLLQKMHLRL